MADEELAGLDAALDKAFSETFEAEEPKVEPSEKSNDSLQDNEKSDKVEIEASSDQGDASESEVETPAEQEPLEAPLHWPREHKEQFAKAPREVQEIWLQRDHDTNADYTRKMQELASVRKGHEGISDALEKHQEHLDLTGIDPGALLDRVLSWQRAWEKDPVKAISHLAGTAGLTLGQLAQMEQQQQSPGRIDPEIQQLKQKLSEIDTFLLKQRESVQQTEIQRLEAEEEAFKNAKDSSGKLLRPHYAEVEAEMVELIPGIRQANPGASITQVLEKAYSKALRLNDAIFEKLDNEKRIAKAKAAKAAGASITGSPGGQGVKHRPASLDESIDLAFSKYS